MTPTAASNRAIKDFVARWEELPLRRGRALSLLLDRVRRAGPRHSQCNPSPRVRAARTGETAWDMQ